MPDHDQITALFLRCLTIVLCIIVLTIGSCVSYGKHETRLLIERTKMSGVEAKCAMDDGTSQLCNSLVIRDAGKR